MTREDYDNIEQALQDAEKSDTPFLIASDDELKVVGDANKTELNLHDFEIAFRLPPEDGGTYRTVKKAFKNVYITPRQDTKILKAITTMMPYFKAARVNGEVERLTDDEKVSIIASLADEAYDIMYDLVAFVLGIDDELKNYMMPGSVMESVVKIIRSFPEAINEADVFFE